MMKVSIIIILAIFSGTLCFSQDDENKYHYNKAYDYENDSIDPLAWNEDSLILFAKQFLGKPYKSGGRDPNGFDCSGFTFYCFKRYGVYLPFSSTLQAEVGERVELVNAKKGDIILFQGHDLADKKVHHVGIVIGKHGNAVEFIHAASHGISIDNSESAYYKPRFITVRKVR